MAGEVSDGAGRRMGRARTAPAAVVEASGFDRDSLVVTVITPLHSRGSRPVWTPVGTVFGDFPSRPSSTRARNQVHPEPEMQRGELESRPTSTDARVAAWTEEPSLDTGGALRGRHAGAVHEAMQEIHPDNSHNTAKPSREMPPTAHTDVTSAMSTVEKLTTGASADDHVPSTKMPYSAENAAAHVEQRGEGSRPAMAAEAASRDEAEYSRAVPSTQEHGESRDINPGPISEAAQLYPGAVQHTTPRSKGGDWRKNRDELDRRMTRCRVKAAVCGLGGSLFAIAQNELVFRQEDPGTLRMNVLKGANSVLTVLCLCFLFGLYRLSARMARLRAHLYSLRPLDPRLRLRDTLSDQSFWLEALLCGCHVPPLVTFEIPSVSMENFVLYRAETVGALVNTLRLYLLWRVLRDRVLRGLPKRHTVAAFHGMSIGSGFAFKTMLTGPRAVPFIAGLWASTMVLLSYWFRAAELTACELATSVHAGCGAGNARNWTLNSLDFFEKQNDLYVQNAGWAMFVTSTTVGYGDIVPTTHFGRTVAALMALIGIVMSALLTASLANSLHWTAAEMSALLVLEREKAREALQQQAGQRIVYWWRTRVRKHRVQWDAYRWKMKFRATKRATQVDVEDCLADKVKIDRLSRNTKAIAAAMDLIERRILSLLGQEVPGSMEGAAAEASLDLLASTLPTASQFRTPHPPPAPVAPDPPRPAAPPAADGSAPAAVQGGAAGLASVAAAAGPAREGGGKAGGRREGVVKGVYRDRAAMDRMRGRCRGLAAGAGLAGAVCAVMQNELLVRGVAPQSGAMNALKAANSVLTAACLALLLRCYWLSAAFQRLQAHIHRGSELQVRVRWRDVLASRALWVELVVCGLHLPPLVTFEVGTTNLTNFILYRAETLFCAVNVLRVYLPWRVLRDWMLADLPRRYTVAAFAHVDLGSNFAIKRMLNSWFSLCYLAGLWALLVLLAGYLFRAAEMTACQLQGAGSGSERCAKEVASAWSIYGQNFEKTNDLYLQNSVWFVFISSMTVGYGDIIPTTHSGRAVAAVAALSGIVMASLVTASLSNLIQWSPDEQSAMGVLLREQARQRLSVAAANMLGLWWRKRKGRRLSRRQRRMDLYQMRRDFNEVKRTTLIEIEDCASTSTKIEQIGRRAKYIQDQLNRVNLLLLPAQPSAPPSRAPSSHHPRRPSLAGSAASHSSAAERRRRSSTLRAPLPRRLPSGDAPAASQALPDPGEVPREHRRA